MAKLIRLTEDDLHRMINECIHIILNESNMSILYHFVNIEQLKHIIENGFTLNDREKEWSISPKLPYFLSLTRNRNAVQGFPYMNSRYSMGGGTLHNEGSEGVFIRLEVDGRKLNTYGKVKPFDYIYKMYQDGEAGMDGELYSGRGEVANMAVNDPNEKEEIYHQPFSQAEERLFSDNDNISPEDSLDLINRIDICILQDYIGIEEENDVEELIQLLNELGVNYKIYNDINKFNSQR